jgi:hypothetical protein
MGKDTSIIASAEDVRFRVLRDQMSEIQISMAETTRCVYSY